MTEDKDWPTCGAKDTDGICAAEQAIPGYSGCADHRGGLCDTEDCSDWAIDPDSTICERHLEDREDAEAQYAHERKLDPDGIYI